MSDRPLSPSKQTSYQLVDLRNQLKSKSLEIKSLRKEVDVQREQLLDAQRELELAVSSKGLLEETLLERESSIKSLRKKCKDVEGERARLAQDLERASLEADNLNTELVRLKGGDADESRDDVVRLHNQLSQYRKEIVGLKGEIRGLENVIKAKDRAIDEGQVEIAKAIDANAEKQRDQNIILDLKRQLKEMGEKLGGEHEYGKLADSENEHFRSLVKSKDEEIEALLEEISNQKDEVIQAHAVRAEADKAMADAAVKMAQAVELSEKALKAEADRMASGGFVAKDKHEVLVAELEAYKNVIRAYEEESTDGKVLAYKSALATSVARARQEELETHKAKVHLANFLGEFEYTLLMNEPPPTEGQLEALQSQSLHADKERQLLSIEVLVEERNEKQKEAESLRLELVSFKKMEEESRANREREVSSLQEQVADLENKIQAAASTGLERHGRHQGAENEHADIPSSLQDAIFEEEIHEKAEIREAENSTGRVNASSAKVIELGDKALMDGSRGNIEAVSSLSKDTDQTMEEEDKILAPVAGKESDQADNMRDTPGTKVSMGEADHSVVYPQIPRSALEGIVDSLIASKEKKGMGGPTSANTEDVDLYHDAIRLLQEELAKIVDEMVRETDVASRIKREVGDWKTAQLSAKQTAELLDSYNAMSMKLAAQANIMSQRQDASDRTERQLLNEISDLRMEIRRINEKSTLRTVKKALSSTVRGIRQISTKGKDPHVDNIPTVSPLKDHAGH
jgi:hypothetical protein